ETGSGLVEEEEAWFGDQLHTNGDAFLLSTAQAADLDIFAMFQVEVFHYLFHALQTLSLSGIGGHAQLGGIVQRLENRELHMDDVLLRHIPNRGANRIELLVDIDGFIDENTSMGSGAISGAGIHQRGFTAH